MALTLLGLTSYSSDLYVCSRMEGGLPVFLAPKNRLQKEQTFKRSVFHSQDLSHSLQASLGLPQSAKQQAGVPAEGTC